VVFTEARGSIYVMPKDRENGAP